MGNKQLIATSKDGEMTTKCPECGEPVTITIQTFIVVMNSGKVPLCRPCMRAVSVQV